MKFLFAGLFFIGSLFLAFAVGRDWQIAFIGIATVIGYLLGQSLSLQKELKTLRDAMAEDWAMRNADSKVTEAVKDEAATVDIADPQTELVNEPVDDQQQEYIDTLSQAAASVSTEEQSVPADNQVSSQQVIAESIDKAATISDSNSSVYIPPETPVLEDSFFDKAVAKVKDYFTGENLFARVGIIILFFGVAFLLKYVSDQGLFPIEYRLIVVVVGAMALLGLGWRLRHKNETYALLLQGAGIGILYLDIFAAFSMYKLIAPTAAFVLLFIVSMFSAALAVLQDSKSLAVLGFSGGFLAPVLASSGSNNHITLFSYYAVLNVAIVAIAWFKAWRPLNLLGFAFTFIIGTIWGVLRYNDDKFATTEPFLIIFFLFYVLIAVLFALRQPPKLRGYVDGTLLFGVPLAASALQYSLVKDFEYGVSISSFAMGLFYLLLSWFVWKRKGDGLKLLAEAFLALGVIFASMAIPFALAPTQTAAAWALEGAGLLWLGSRQNRLSVRAFGLLLQVGAGLIFLGRFRFMEDLTPFINGQFISSMMMAVAGIVSARLLIKPYESRQDWEKGISPVYLGWGLLWLFAGFAYQFIAHYDYKWISSNLLILTAIISLGFTLVAMRFKPEWKHAWYVASGLFAVVLALAIGQFGSTAYQSVYHPSQWNGWIAWPIVFAVFYFHLHKLQTHKVFERIQPLFHTAALILLTVLLTLEGSWWLQKQLARSSSWLEIWYVIPATLSMWMIIKARFWPFSTHQQSYRQQTGLVFAAYLSLWSFFALVSKGQSEPLPWIPLLNPLDIMLVIVFISLFKWWRSSELGNLALTSNYSAENKGFNKRLLIISFAALVFLWLNFTLFRIAHHWFGIAYEADVLFRSNWVQTAVSILWALSGVLLTLYSSRKNIRLLWVTGAVLLGLVVLKLFVIDLAALGSLGRVISFLVVGALLTSIGYFAPLPDKSGDSFDTKPDSDIDSDMKEEKLNA